MKDIYDIEGYLFRKYHSPPPSPSPFCSAKRGGKSGRIFMLEGAPEGHEGLFGKAPSHFLAENIYSLPKGRALDLAAGEGRNAVFLAQHGYQVDAVDISNVALEKARRLALEKGVKINIIQADLDHYEIEKGAYDVIANFNFLNRMLIPQIKEGLKKGGLVIFESYTIEQKDIPWGPKDPRYLLNPNELLDLFKDLRILLYKEGTFDIKGRKKASAYLIAKKE